MPPSVPWLRRLLNGGKGSDSDLMLHDESSARAEGDALTPARDHNEFAVRMYAQLGGRSGNLIFSPLNVRAVLGMALAGALES